MLVLGFHPALVFLSRRLKRYSLGSHALLVCVASRPQRRTVSFFAQVSIVVASCSLQFRMQMRMQLPNPQRVFYLGWMTQVRKACRCQARNGGFGNPNQKLAKKLQSNGCRQGSPGIW